MLHHVGSLYILFKVCYEEAVLKQSVSPDDEQDVLETCREL